ncbi:MAG: 16S rRNA (uracil(1498)-N(3))-methyltransferase [Erysipelotrichia bacterium]|nr:16S rRNA (uracil(1498)-N(3))-methyltransferase [Erysipelotrichia bacterium]
MQQYFIKESVNFNNPVVFDKEQSNHIQKVMRMQANTVVKVVDANGSPFLATIYYEEKAVKAKIVEALEKQCEKIEITLIQGMIKKEKWEFLIQKCCELGVSKIIPMISSRTIVKVDKEDHKKIERYNKIALEACEQCKRDTLVQVSSPIRFKDIASYKSELNIVAYEDIHFTSESLKAVLSAHPDVKKITYVIGSEGGFAQEEILTLQAEGFICVSLGKRILRAETAAMSVVNVTHYHLD